jgi:hypothetical protein
MRGPSIPEKICGEEYNTTGHRFPVILGEMMGILTNYHGRNNVAMRNITPIIKNDYHFKSLFINKVYLSISLAVLTCTNFFREIINRNG